MGDLRLLVAAAVVLVLVSGLRASGKEMTRAEIEAGVKVREVVSRDGKAMTLPSGDRFTKNVTIRKSGDAAIVTVEITDRTKTDCAARVSYEIPLDNALWAWHADLSNTGKKEGSQSNYPISVASKEAAGLAIAISPETPCMFTAGCSNERGLYVEARLGFSPATNRPSRASVQFAIYQTDGKWGMRSALKEYYRLFPESFECTAKEQGLWLFHGYAAGLPNPTDFKFHEIAELNEAQRTGKQASDLIAANRLADEKKWGIELYPYVIPGQREIAFLEHIKGEDQKGKLAAEGDRELELPDVHYTTAEAMAVLDAATEKNLTVAMTDQSLADFRQTIRNSMLTGADGDVLTRPRIVPWAQKALTFPTNPNPFITGRDRKLNIGSVVMEQARQSLVGPADGIYIDSLARWGNYLDYNREHFAATRMGLTFGEDGRPCLDNSLEHLTFIDELCKMLRPKGRKVFGNGVGMERWWHALRLDISGSEMGNASIERYQFSRAACCRKPYLALMHTMGKNKLKDRQFLAKCIAFGVYGSGDRDYYVSPDYAATKPIYEVYLPIQCEMNKLGWEPVTAAKAVDPKVLVERFGDGKEMYFTLYDGSGKAKSADVELDCGRLGIRSAGIEAVEAGSKKELKAQQRGADAAVIGVPLTSDGFAVIKVTAKGES